MTTANHSFANALRAIDVGLLASDRAAARTARESSDALLVAQLRAGQHTLVLSHARQLAEIFGIQPRLIRPGIGSRRRRA